MSAAAGTLLVIVSTVAFGAMALFARIAYAAGISPTTLLFLRFGIAALFTALIVLVRREPHPPPRVIGGLALMGGVGCVGLVALLLYLYPAIVALLSAALFRELLDPPRVATDPP